MVHKLGLPSGDGMAGAVAASQQQTLPGTLESGAVVHKWKRRWRWPCCLRCRCALLSSLTSLVVRSLPHAPVNKLTYAPTTAPAAPMPSCRFCHAIDPCMHGRQSPWTWPTQGSHATCSHRSIPLAFSVSLPLSRVPGRDCGPGVWTAAASWRTPRTCGSWFSFGLWTYS